MPPISALKSHISLGFSPCPNDCFIFDAMIHSKIDTEGLSFDVKMGDVEELNRNAFTGAIDITKLSYAAYTQLTDKYILLNAGSALGFGVGPLLISKVSHLMSQIADLKIAIPGKNTTANFLFTLAFLNAKNKVEYLFSEIEDAVLTGKVDAGLIIHENRFTYEQKGLNKIIDLGEWWEIKTGAAIPLGGIVANKKLSDAIKHKIDRVIRKSVEYAFANPESCMGFVSANAQEMEEVVMKKHIELYVNKYSIDLGEAGRRAVRIFFDKALEVGIISSAPKNIFLE